MLLTYIEIPHFFYMILKLLLNTLIERRATLRIEFLKRSPYAAVGFYPVNSISPRKQDTRYRSHGPGNASVEPSCQGITASGDQQADDSGIEQHFFKPAGEQVSRGRRSNEQGYHQYGTYRFKGDHGSKRH